MYIEVSETPGGSQKCVLVEPGDLGSLSVRAGKLDAAAVGRVLESEHAGRPIGDGSSNVYVSIAWLRRVGSDSWGEAEFVRMVESAGKAGWVDPLGEYLMAHIDKQA
ncbi:hypothetical protein [Streptomyces sp. NPDC057199]|uniref:hypothetical protein n=1 Tax=Streptomyces sp. NPDC057199 TaxID=3346047 RepID=UPI00362F140F